MEGIIVDIIVDIKLQQSSIWSLSTAPCRALRELRREPLAELRVELLVEILAEILAELLAEPLAKPLAEPLTQFLTRFWRVLYLTKSLLIYNNFSSKLDFTINFFSCRFCKEPAKVSTRSSA